MKDYSIDDFKAGEVVYLKSDYTIALTVSKVDKGEELVQCFRRDKKTGNLINETLPPAVLCKEADKPRPTLRFQYL